MKNENPMSKYGALPIEGFGLKTSNNFFLLAHGAVFYWLANALTKNSTVNPLTELEKHTFLLLPFVLGLIFCGLTIFCGMMAQHFRSLSSLDAPVFLGAKRSKEYTETEANKWASVTPLCVVVSAAMLFCGVLNIII